MLLQLEGADKSAKQLKDTLGELEGSVRDKGYQQHVDMMGGIMKQKDKEMSRMRAAEKARVRLCCEWLLKKLG